MAKRTKSRLAVAGEGGAKGEKGTLASSATEGALSGRELRHCLPHSRALKYSGRVINFPARRCARPVRYFAMNSDILELNLVPATHFAVPRLFRSGDTGPREKYIRPDAFASTPARSLLPRVSLSPLPLILIISSTV